MSCWQNDPWERLRLSARNMALTLLQDHGRVPELPEKAWFGVDGRTLATNERIWHMMFSNLGMDVNGVWDQLPQIFQTKKCAAQTTRFDVLVLSPKSIARGSLHGFVNLKLGCQKKYSLSSSIIFPLFCYRQCILHNMSGLKAEVKELVKYGGFLK